MHKNSMKDEGEVKTNTSIIPNNSQELLKRLDILIATKKEGHDSSDKEISALSNLFRNLLFQRWICLLLWMRTQKVTAGYL